MTKSLIDYNEEDYKAFLFVIHKKHGIVLLHCTRKKKKGPHFQCPGGGVDGKNKLMCSMFLLEWN